MTICVLLIYHYFIQDVFHCSTILKAELSAKYFITKMFLFIIYWQIEMVILLLVHTTIRLPYYEYCIAIYE